MAFSAMKTEMNMLFAGWCPGFNLTYSNQNLKGRNAIVTGANTGIGYETAKAFAEMGASVTLACRNAEKATVAKDKIIKETGNAEVSVGIIDFSDLSSVRAFVKEWGTKPVDILVNNAGMTTNTFARGKDGHELCLTTNYLSHFLLSALLLPNLATNARIVNISSAGSYGFRAPMYNPVEDFDSTKWLESKSYKLGQIIDNAAIMALYSKTKFYQLLLTRDLQKWVDEPVNGFKDKNIVVQACHPGLVQSDIWDRPTGGFAGTGKKIIGWIVSIFGITNQQGAVTQIWLSTAPEAVQRKGSFWDRKQWRSPNALIEDREKSEIVWKMTREAVGLSEELKSTV